MSQVPEITSDNLPNLLRYLTGKTNREKKLVLESINSDTLKAMEKSLDNLVHKLISKSEKNKSAKDKNKHYLNVFHQLNNTERTSASKLRISDGSLKKRAGFDSYIVDNKLISYVKKLTNVISELRDMKFKTACVNTALKGISRGFRLYDMDNPEEFISFLESYAFFSDRLSLYFRNIQNGAMLPEDDETSENALQDIFNGVIIDLITKGKLLPNEDDTLTFLPFLKHKLGRFYDLIRRSGIISQNMLMSLISLVFSIYVIAIGRRRELVGSNIPQNLLVSFLNNILGEGGADLFINDNPDDPYRIKPITARTINDVTNVFVTGSESVAGTISGYLVEVKRQSSKSLQDKYKFTLKYGTGLIYDEMRNKVSPPKPVHKTSVYALAKSTPMSYDGRTVLSFDRLKKFLKGKDPSKFRIVYLVNSAEELRPTGLPDRRNTFTKGRYLVFNKKNITQVRINQGTVDNVNYYSYLGFKTVAKYFQQNGISNNLVVFDTSVPTVTLVTDDTGDVIPEVDFNDTYVFSYDIPDDYNTLLLNFENASERLDLFESIVRDDIIDEFDASDNPALPVNGYSKYSEFAARQAKQSFKEQKISGARGRFLDIFEDRFE